MLNSKPKRRTDRQKTRTVSRGSKDLGIELQKKFFFDEDNSYIDYFLEIGAKPEILKYTYLYDSESIEDINDNLIPQIICKFPNFDKKNIVVENSILNQIFPHGFNVVESQTPPEPIFFCLTLDNQLFSMVYTTKYLACLIIYEDIDNYKKLYDKYQEEDSIFNSAIAISEDIKPKKLQMKKTLRKYYIPKCLCIASVHAYIDKYEEILRTIYDMFLDNKSQTIFMDCIIEKLITETPKVPRGYKLVVLEFPNKEIDISENKMNELPSINTNLLHIFDLLSITNVIEIFKYLMYETKLIFFSKNLYDLTNTLLSFLLLLSPFKYQFQIVSILPKDFYNYIETISPYIFGINEAFTDTFFTDNRINIEDATICAVDIDNHRYLILPSGQNLSPEEYPEIPKRLYKKLETKLNACYSDFKKDIAYIKTICDLRHIISNKEKIIGNKNLTHSIKEMNERYQLCFYKFMISVFIDYPKYLTKDYSVNRDISMSIQDMIDINNYLNSFNYNEKPFYNKMFNTQLFIEFIYKRMMPKDCREKVEVLFFEEKINEKTASKNLFGGAKLKSQNVLLNCKDYDYDNDIVYVDLRGDNNLSTSLSNYIYNKIDSLKKDFIYKGYIVNVNQTKKQITFNYILFPSLLSEKFFMLNADTYQMPVNYDKEMDAINTKIVNKSYLKFIQRDKNLKNTEVENDLYICYLIIWSLTFWYSEECERELRFLQMLKILEKIEEHDIKTFELLFKALVEYSNDENVIIVYKKFIHLRLNPTWEIFTLVSKMIKKKQSIKKKTQLLLQDTNANDLNEKYIKENKMGNVEKMRDRTLFLQNKYDNIFSNDALFYAYLKCSKCKKTTNLKELCCNLSSLNFEKDNYSKQRIRCTNKNIGCNAFYESLIKIRLGKELYNKKVFKKDTYNKIKTSFTGEVLFMSPDEIKTNLLNICLNDKNKFDVDGFRYNYPDIFWNLILYFVFNNIDITFMLPYSPLNGIKDGFGHELENEIKTHVKHIRQNNDYLYETNTNGNNNDHVIDLTNNNIHNNYMVFNNNNKLEYKDEDLFVQNVYNFRIEDNFGMISYKNIFSNEENIGYNELPMISLDKDNNSTSSDSLNNDEDTLMLIRQRTKNQRNLSTPLVEIMRNTTGVSSIYSRQLTKKNTKRDTSNEKKCFEFEDSDEYLSDDEKKE